MLYINLIMQYSLTKFQNTPQLTPDKVVPTLVQINLDSPQQVYQVKGFGIAKSSPKKKGKTSKKTKTKKAKKSHKNLAKLQRLQTWNNSDLEVELKFEPITGSAQRRRNQTALRIAGTSLPRNRNTFKSIDATSKLDLMGTQDHYQSFKSSFVSQGQSRERSGRRIDKIRSISNAMREEIKSALSSRHVMSIISDERQIEMRSRRSKTKTRMIRDQQSIEDCNVSPEAPVRVIDMEDMPEKPLRLVASQGNLMSKTPKSKSLVKEISSALHSIASLGNLFNKTLLLKPGIRLSRKDIEPQFKVSSPDQLRSVNLISGPSFNPGKMSRPGQISASYPQSQQQSIKNNNIQKVLNNLKTEREKIKMNKGHQKYLTNVSDQKNTFMEKLAKMNSEANLRDQEKQQSNFKSYEKLGNQKKLITSTGKPVLFGMGPKQQQNSKFGNQGSLQQDTGDFGGNHLANRNESVSGPFQVQQEYQYKQATPKRIMTYEDENIQTTDRNNPSSARHQQRIMAPQSHNMMRQSDEIKYPRMFDQSNQPYSSQQVQNQYYPVNNNYERPVNEEDPIQFQGDTQAPLTEDDDDEYALSSINPTSSILQYDATDELIKESIPRNKRSSGVKDLDKHKESVASAGYDADQDPYTQLRNQRKMQKESTMQIDLTESISKVEELNKVIQEHKMLISPKVTQIPKQILQQEVMVMGIQVEPEAPQEQPRFEPKVQYEQQNLVMLTEINDVTQTLDQSRDASQISRIEEKAFSMQEYLQSLPPSERRQMELKSLLMIQKWVRGHQARVWGKRQALINFKQMRKLRRLLSVAYGKKRARTIKKLTLSIREAGNLYANKEYKLWKQYQNHCAKMIQKNWRGYSLRFLEINDFNTKVWQAKKTRCVNALVQGFKTRLLLSPKGYNKVLHTIRHEIFKSTNQSTDSKAMIIDVNDRITLKNLMKRRRQKVVELIKQFSKIYNSEGIIVSLLIAKRRIEQQERNKQLETQKSSRGQRPSQMSYLKKSQDVKQNDNFWNAEEDQLSDQNTKSLWPSQIKDEPEEEELQSIWPSQIQEGESLAKKKSVNKSSQVLEDYPEEQDQKEEDFDWLNMGKKQDSPRKSVNFDERPIKPSVKSNNFVNIDDMPVGVHKRSSKLENPPVLYQEEQEQPNQVQEQQLAGSSPSQRKSNVRNEGSDGLLNAAPMQYDFEKMIEEAMKAGDGANAPAVQALGQKPRQEGESRAAVNEPDSKAKKHDKNKQNLLEKRKKYDPRAAIKNEKEKKEHKSALSMPQLLGERMLDGQQAHQRDKSQLSVISGAPEHSEFGQEEDKKDEENTKNSPNAPPRPFLKRKSKAVVVTKKEELKQPEGKSRIDCWHRDKDTNVLIYGNRAVKAPRKNLMKKSSKASASKLKRMSQANMQTSQFGGNGNGSQNQNQNQNQNQTNTSQYPQSNQFFSPAGKKNFMNFEESEAESIIPDENDFTGQDGLNFFTETNKIQAHSQEKMNIDELEKMFNQLHGPDYFLEDEMETEQFLYIQNPSQRRQMQQSLTGARLNMNSHDFNYSMMAFSPFNCSKDVNLYTPQSQIPYLYKTRIAEVPNLPVPVPDEASLFFKCYSDDIYEAILEDVRAHYMAISNQDLADSDENEDGEYAEDQYLGGLHEQQPAVGQVMRQR